MTRVSFYSNAVLAPEPAHRLHPGSPGHAGFTPGSALRLSWLRLPGIPGFSTKSVGTPPQALEVFPCFPLFLRQTKTNGETINCKTATGTRQQWAVQPPAPRLDRQA